MKNILICSIIRNQEHNLNFWYNQIFNLTKILKENNYNVSLSIFENDSQDKTKEILSNFDFSFLNLKKNESKNFGTIQYSSIWSYDRLKNLAFYRQQCLEGIDLTEFDKIAYIEPDIIYDPYWCSELVLANHLKSINIEPDIYSAWSLRSMKHPKESMYLYDTCATRYSEFDLNWDVAKENEIINKSLIKTYLSPIDSNCIHKVWSTFNCFCVYSSKPFIENNIKWNFINTRLDTKQGSYHNGWLEADTVVICEDFHKNGYHNIYLNKNCIVRHIN